MMIPLALMLSGPLAYAKNDGAPHGKQTVGGSSPQHMSVSGRENTNSPVYGQQKGDQRAMERKNEHGNLPGIDGNDSQGKAKGHTKDKAKGKAKGHDK